MRKNHKKMRGQHKTADFSNVEILLIEDGAKDASGALCDSFAGEDARIRVLHKKRRGIRCPEFGNGHGAGDLHPVYGQ